LKSIGTSARQHLVDTDDVVWVWADAHVESFLSGNLDEVLVGGDTGGLEGLGAELLKLVGNQVDTCWELVDVGALTAQVEDTNLWVWDTTVEAGLWVWLAVGLLVCICRRRADFWSRENALLAVAVAPCWTSRHFVGICRV